MLARVPKQRVRERDAYEFFVRTEPDGNVIWSHGIADRGAVLTHPGAVCRSHTTYHPSLKRYLLTMTGPGSEPRFEGSLGTYDAPEPGGPWTTVFCTDAWDVGPVHSASFASKWFSADGRTAWLVFSDDGSFSVWRGTLELVADWQTTRIPVNRGDSG